MPETPLKATAEALRKVTAAIQAELHAGRRSSRLDAHDLVDILLAVADEIDPPFGSASPARGQRKRPRRDR